MVSTKRDGSPAWTMSGLPPNPTRCSSRSPKGPAIWASSLRVPPMHPAPIARCGRPTAASCSRSTPKYRCYNRGMADSWGHPPAGRPAGNKSGRTVLCSKFQKELPGLDAPPWPGELGQRIYDNISADAWKLWEERMKMILNEYRLMPWQKEAQDLVAKHMEEFFFGEGAALPPVSVH